MNNERFLLLLQKYADGFITLKEHDELFHMLASGQYNHLLDRHLDGAIKEKSGPEVDLPPHIAQEIVHNIFEAEQSTARALPKKNPFPVMRWLAAASVAACVVVAAYYLKPVKNDTPYQPQSFATEKLKVTTNETASPLLVRLDDGSLVSLQPGASLQYPQTFTGDKREVLLKGEGSFDIAKKTQQPFYVYYNHIVTKVVGTSFTVGTNRLTGNPEVAVQRGKVQVYATSSAADKNVNGVILTPNYKVVYDKMKKILQTTLVDHPIPVDVAETGIEKAAPGRPSFVYEQERLDKVLKHLEAYFGIQLVVENEALNHCFFTGDLSRGDLYDQLRIVCLTMRASYEINGTSVLIKGKGCSEYIH